VLSDILLWGREILIVTLTLVLVLCLLKIQQLRRQIARESRKKLIPVVSMEILPHKPGMFLKNQGHCYVKDLKVEDFRCELDYDFKKTVMLKFDRVGFLKPQEAVRLDVRIFDGKHQIPTREAEGLYAHLARARFEATINCANIENSKYTITLSKDQEDFHIKQILPQVE